VVDEQLTVLLAERGNKRGTHTVAELAAALWMQRVRLLLSLFLCHCAEVQQVYRDRAEERRRQAGLAPAERLERVTSQTALFAFDGPVTSAQQLSPPSALARVRSRTSIAAMSVISEDSTQSR
jgi:hypothetical protein